MNTRMYMYGCTLFYSPPIEGEESNHVIQHLNRKFKEKINLI